MTDNQKKQIDNIEIPEEIIEKYSDGDNQIDKKDAQKETVADKDFYQFNNSLFQNACSSVKMTLERKVKEKVYFEKEEERTEFFQLLNDEEYQKQLETPLKFEDIEHVINKSDRPLTLSEKEKIIDTRGAYTAFGKSLIPYDLVNRGLFIVGGIGAGKTVTMNQINHGVRINGVKCSLGLVDLNEAMFIYVRKESDFVADMYRKGIDIKLGSRDYDTKKVNYAAALKDPLTGKADSTMCLTWAKTGMAGDDHFSKQAVLVAAPLLEHIAEIPNVDNKILMDTILSVAESADKLLDFLENSPTVQAKGKIGTIRRALTTDKDGNLDAQGGSVFATLNDFFNTLVDEQFYYEGSEDDFVHKEYILNEMNQNVIRRRVFIMNTTDADNNDFYTQMNLKLIFKYGLQLPQDRFDRMWMLMDEIQSVAAEGNEKAGKLFLQEYISFMAESRSYGWCHIAGTQSISRLEAILDSKFNRRAFYQMFTCKLYMKYNEPEDLEYVVKDFGKVKIKKTKENFSMGEKTEGDRISESEDEKIENVIEADEIGSLPNLSGFIKIGNYPPAFIQYEYWKPKKIHTRIRGLENSFDMGTTTRHYHDMIIQRFKKVLIDTLIETGNHNFSYEKFLKFKELNYKTKELFAKKLENVAKVRGERLIQYLPFIFEEELITDFCDRYIDTEHFKKTEDVYKLLIEETGLK